ncbi:hypothetical protein V2J09_012594 [Rumex salicifolius]
MASSNVAIALSKRKLMPRYHFNIGNTPSILLPISPTAPSRLHSLTNLLSMPCSIEFPTTPTLRLLGVSASRTSTPTRPLNSPTAHSHESSSPIIPSIRGTYAFTNPPDKSISQHMSSLMKPPFRLPPLLPIPSPLTSHSPPHPPTPAYLPLYPHHHRNRHFRPSSRAMMTAHPCPNSALPTTRPITKSVFSGVSGRCFVPYSVSTTSARQSSPTGHIRS